MDAYVVGITGIMLFLGLFTVAALFFFSIESGEQNTADEPPYAQVQHIDTNTIETVDVAGQVQRWQRLAE
jgi:hypothetical protein